MLCRSMYVFDRHVYISIHHHHHNHPLPQSMNQSMNQTEVRVISTSTATTLKKKFDLLVTPIACLMGPYNPVVVVEVS